MNEESNIPDNFSSTNTKSIKNSNHIKIVDNLNLRLNQKQLQILNNINKTNNSRQQQLNSPKSNFQQQQQQQQQPDFDLSSNEQTFVSSHYNNSNISSNIQEQSNYYHNYNRFVNYMRNSRVYTGFKNINNKFFSVRKFLLAYLFYNINNQKTKKIEYYKDENVQNLNQTIDDDKNIQVKLKNKKSLKELSRISNTNELKPTVFMISGSAVNNSNMKKNKASFSSQRSCSVSSSSNDGSVKSNYYNIGSLNNSKRDHPNSRINDQGQLRSSSSKQSFSKENGMKNFYLSSNNILYDSKSEESSKSNKKSAKESIQSKSAQKQLLNSKWVTLVSNANNVTHAVPNCKPDETANRSSLRKKNTHNNSRNSSTSSYTTTTNNQLTYGDSSLSDFDEDSNFYFNNKYISVINSNFNNQAKNFYHLNYQNKYESENDRTTMSEDIDDDDDDEKDNDSCSSSTLSSSPESIQSLSAASTDNYLYYQPSSTYGHFNYMLYDIPEEEIEEENEIENHEEEADNQIAENNEEILKI
jgi:hypothetical protein